MIRFIVTDSAGLMDRTGHASAPEAVYLQKGPGERVFVCPDVGFIDAGKLRIDVNNMLISQRDGVTEDLQGVGVSVVELIRASEDADS